MLPEAEYLASLPRKRISGALLVRNPRAEILIVKPCYRPYWLVPGGVVEPWESPRQAAAREAAEEVGLTIAPGRLLAIDHARSAEPADECLHFIFDGGVLTAATEASIQLADGEIAECRFVGASGLTVVEPRLADRLRHALISLRDGGCPYLEDGRPVA